jgi:replicative DNA helicase
VKIGGSGKLAHFAVPLFFHDPGSSWPSRSIQLTRNSKERSPSRRSGDRHLRIPPHSIEAEQSVLGGLLLDNAAFDKIADLVGEDDFYRDEHKRIYRQIRKLLERSKPVDVVTVAESLDLAGEGSETGGLAYLGELAANTPSAANIRRYAEIVRERAILRQLVTAGDEIAGSALNPLGRDPKQLLDEAEAKVFAIAEGGFRHQTGFQHINPLLTQVVERIQELHDRDNPSDITGRTDRLSRSRRQDVGAAAR